MSTQQQLGAAGAVKEPLAAAVAAATIGKAVPASSAVAAAPATAPASAVGWVVNKAGKSCLQGKLPEFGWPFVRVELEINLAAAADLLILLQNSSSWFICSTSWTSPDDMTCSRRIFLADSNLARKF
jgi:hypothetical protein